MLAPETLYPISKANKGLIFLKNFITNPNIQVGDYTYYDGRGRPESFEQDNVIFGYTAKLKIGKFCQLAFGTKFVLADANHQMTIVGGNPAKIIRQRFSDAIIENLLDIAWWDWSYEKISRNIPLIISIDIQKLRSCH